VSDAAVAIIVAVLGGLTGLAALIRANQERRRTGREADKVQAEASATIVGSAGDVVTMLREQMADLHARLDQAEARILLLETEVGTWEEWAERVLDLLDRALDMMSLDKADNIRPDVEDVKKSRPLRRRRET
jgi:predicted trehalose synthase